MSYDANVTVMGRIGSEPRFFMAEGEAPDFVSFGSQPPAATSTATQARGLTVRPRGSP